MDGPTDDKVMRASVDILRRAAKVLAEFRRSEQEDGSSFQGEQADIQEVVLVAQVLSSSALLSSLKAQEGGQAQAPRVPARAPETSEEAEAKLQLRALQTKIEAEMAEAVEEGVAHTIGYGDWRDFGYPRPPHPPVAEVYFAPPATLQLVIAPFKPGDKPTVTLCDSFAKLSAALEKVREEMIRRGIRGTLEGPAAE